MANEECDCDGTAERLELLDLIILGAEADADTEGGMLLCCALEVRAAMSQEWRSIDNRFCSAHAAPHKVHQSKIDTKPRIEQEMTRIVCAVL